MDADVRALRVETRTEFAAVRVEAKAGFDKIDERFEALHRLAHRASVAVVIALVALVATRV